MTIPVEDIIIGFGYFGIFGLMITNGISSFPSSQLLYIIVGYFISQGALNLWVASLLGAIGNAIGNIILYEIVRSKGLAYAMRFQIIPARELKKVTVALRKRGAWFVFIGKLIPAIKVFVPIAAGLAQMPRALYIVLIAISSWIWSLGFIAIGYFFGKSSRVFGPYAIVLTIISLVVAGLFYKYINSREVVDEIEGV